MVFSLGSQSRTVMLTRLLPILETGDLSVKQLKVLILQIYYDLIILFPNGQPKDWNLLFILGATKSIGIN